MSSSYISKELLKNEAYMTRNREDYYITTNGVCHPEYETHLLSERGVVVCIRKDPGKLLLNPVITKPRTNSLLSHSHRDPKNIPREKLYSTGERMHYGVRVDSKTMAYSGTPLPPEGYSQVNNWHSFSVGGNGELKSNDVVPNQNYLVDNAYLGRHLTFDGIGFGSVQREDRHDYLFYHTQTNPPPPMPRKYNVNDLTQRYPIWKEATGAPDQVDLTNTRRIV